MKAEKVFATAREIVKILGIEPDRVRLEWISSAEGTKFAEVATDFTEQIKKLGPLKLQTAA